MVEIRGLGGEGFERALERFRAGEPVTYRGMELVLRGAAFECRVPAPEMAGALTDRRALEALIRARFRLGALLASAPPLEAVVGNRPPRLVLVRAADAEEPREKPSDEPREEPRTEPRESAPRARRYEELYELRGDRLRRLRGGPPR